MSRTAWCDLSQVRGLPYWTADAAAWGLGLAVAALLAARRTPRGRTLWECAGFAILSVPAWNVVLHVSPDWIRTFCAQGNVAAILPGPPAVPPSSLDFLMQAWAGASRVLPVLALGAALILLGRRQGPGALLELLAMPRGLAVSVRQGVALFPVLALVNLALVAATGLAIRTSGENAYYLHMQALSATALALQAGIVEELVYRGVMQQGILALLRTRMPAAAAIPIAIAAQAIPFAYAHASYGDPVLLLFAFLFACAAGAVAQWLGVGAAIALHVLIDFFAFLTQSPQPDLVFWSMAALVAAAVVAISAVEARQAWRHLQAWLREWIAQ